MVNLNSWSNALRGAQENQIVGLAEGPRQKGEVKTGTLGGRTVTLVPSGTGDVHQNAQIRETLFKSLQDGVGQTEQEKEFIQRTREQLGIDDKGKAKNDTSLKALDAREIVNVGRAQNKNATAMLEKAMSAIIGRVPPKALASIKATILDQANHPDVVAFLDKYGNGGCNVKLLQRLCDLALQTAPGDRMTQAYLRGFRGPERATAAPIQGLNAEAEMEKAAAEHRDAQIESDNAPPQPKGNVADAGKAKTFEDREISIKSFSGEFKLEDDATQKAKSQTGSFKRSAVFPDDPKEPKPPPRTESKSKTGSIKRSAVFPDDPKEPKLPPQTESKSKTGSIKRSDVFPDDPNFGTKLGGNATINEKTMEKLGSEHANILLENENPDNQQMEGTNGEPKKNDNDIQRQNGGVAQTNQRSPTQIARDKAQFYFDHTSPREPKKVRNLVDGILADQDLQRLFTEYDRTYQNQDEGSSEQANFRFAFSMACQNVQNKILDRIKDHVEQNKVPVEDALKKLDLRAPDNPPTNEQVSTFEKYLDEHDVVQSAKEGDRENVKKALVSIFKQLPASVTDMMSKGQVASGLDVGKKRHHAGAAIVDMVAHMAVELGMVKEGWPIPSKQGANVQEVVKQCQENGFKFGDNTKNVCEAGCAKWLAAMQKGGGYAEAKKLTQDDCVNLQNIVENGSALYADDDKLAQHVHAQRTTFANASLHGPHDAANAFRALTPGKMAFLALSDGIFHHAMAVYADPNEAGTLYFFNPGKGVWKGTADEMAVVLQQQVSDGLGMGRPFSAVTAQFLEPLP